MKELELLYRIEEKLESYYIRLAQLEINGELGSYEYNNCLKEISELINDEKKILINTDRKVLLKMLKVVKKDNDNKNTTTPIALGHLTNAYYFRIINMLELSLADDLIDYAGILRYDLNQILFSFLEVMINNDYYSDIKPDLIMYKYNQIFLNSFSEQDFIFNKDIATVKLETKSYRTDDLLSYKYVDQTILAFESVNFYTYITTMAEDFKESNSSYTLGVISTINVLARLMLCEEDTLHLIYDDLIYLLEDDMVYSSIKDLVKEMLAILENLKNKIVWMR